MIIFIFLILIGTVLLLKHLFFWRPVDVDHLYNDGPLLMGHRGAPMEAPENTLLSFQKALEKGIRGIEVDVISTADGELVCSHNHDLERETDGFGYIHETLYTDLKSIDAGVKFPKLERSPLAKLKDIIVELPTSTIFNIEIKSLHALDFSSVRTVIKIISEKNLFRRVFISSFNPLVLWRVKMFDRNIPTAYLWSDENVPPILTKPRFINLVHPDMLHPSAHLVDDKVLLFAQQKKLRINVWTVNNLPAMKWLLKKGADGLISDFPALLPEAVCQNPSVTD